MIRSTLLMTAGVFITAFVTSFVAITSPFLSRGENTIHRVANLWARLLLLVSNV